MGGSDLDEELDEMDVLRCAQVSEMCESLVHSLQIIENPQMRYLLATVSPKMARQGPQGNRPEGDEPVTYIVAPKLRAGMLKTFQGNLYNVIYLEQPSNSKVLLLIDQGTLKTENTTEVIFYEMLFFPYEFVNFDQLMHVIYIKLGNNNNLGNLPAADYACPTYK